MTTIPRAAPTDEERQRTLRLSLYEGLIWSITWGFGEAYITPFAIFLGASPLIVALFGTLPAFLGAGGQILGAELADRLGRRRPVVVAGILIQALSFVPLFLLPLAFPARGAAIALVVYCVTFFLFCGGAPVWNSLMGDVVPANRRGRYFGTRARVVLLGMVTCMLLASFTLSLFKGHGHTWAGFGVLFGAAFVARAICAWIMHLHIDPPIEPLPPSEHSGLWARLRGSPYAFFALVQTVLGGAFSFAAPFFNLYMLRDLQWGYVQFTAMTVVFFIAQVSVVHWWGELADRHGNRVVYRATCMLMPIPHLVWFVTTDFRVLLVAQILSGALTAGNNIAAGNYFFDAVPPALRARTSSYINVVASFANLVAAGVLGAFVAKNFPTALTIGGMTVTLSSSLPVIFLTAGLLRFLLSLLLLPHLKEVRSIEPISSMKVILRFAAAEPIREQMGQLAARFVPGRWRRNGG